jgi:hypothetical protein
MDVDEIKSVFINILTPSENYSHSTPVSSITMVAAAAKDVKEKCITNTVSLSN